MFKCIFIRTKLDEHEGSAWRFLESCKEKHCTENMGRQIIARYILD